MKRFLMVLGVLLLLVGGVALWVLTRETPEKVMKSTLAALLNWKTAKELSVDVAWTSDVSKTTTGFTVLGQVDVADFTKPRALGVLRLGARSALEQDQTGDMVLEKNLIAMRPRSVSADLRAYAQDLSKDPTGEVFLTVDRNAFLRNMGFGEAIARGSDVDLRNEFSFVTGAVKLGALSLTKVGDRSLATLEFTFDKKNLHPLLISMVHAWTGDTPTVNEYGWMARVENGLSLGKFKVVLDRKTRLPIEFSGTWPVVNDDGDVVLKARMTVALDGYNEKVGIGIPGKSKDVSSQTVLQPVKMNALPASALRPLPNSSSTVATSSTSPGQVTSTKLHVIKESDIDLFSKYYDQMNKSNGLRKR